MEKDKFNFAFTSDLLIFGVDSRENKNTRSLPKKYFSVLMIKRNKEPFNGLWCLPGGYVNKDETSKDSSLRILKKETGLSNVYMQQLCVNDTIDRDPRGRTLSLAYMSLVDRTKIKEVLNEEASWFDIEVSEDGDIIKVILDNGIERIEYSVRKILVDEKTDEYEYQMINGDKLGFDHEKIVVEGIFGLRNKAMKTDIIFNLMPELFTIGELKQVYEVILGHKLVNSAFRRTIADKVLLTDDMVKTGGHRPSVLCKYRSDK